MSQNNTEPKSWLIRVHQKINDGMVDSNLRLAWLRSKFGMLGTSVLLLTLGCNWVVIYWVPVEAMPAWFSWLAQWVVETIPGAKANVLHSWYLRDQFPYIYTVNLFLGVLVFLVVMVGSSIKPNAPVLNIVSVRGIVKFHSSYIVLSMMSIYFVLQFYSGFWLEPVFFPKPSPTTSAGGAAIGYRMYETRFGALIIYGVGYGVAMPFIVGACLQLAGRW